MPTTNLGPWSDPSAGSPAGLPHVGDVAWHKGIFWQCLTAGTVATPGATADWAPVGNGQLLAAKEYNPATSAPITWTATTLATAAALDATNLALLQSAYPNLRGPASGNALVEFEALAWPSVAAAMRWVVMSSATAGAVYNGPDGNAVLADVSTGTPSDTLLTRRRTTFIIGGLTPGVAFNVYWGAYISTGTGNIGPGVSNNWGQVIMKVSAA